MRLIVCLAAILALAAPTSAAEREFRNWHAACGEDGYCAATTMSGDGMLRVGRHGEQSYWEISFTPGSATADEWQDFTVTVDGTPEAFSPRTEVGAYGAATDFYLLGDKAQAVMDRMMPGEVLGVSYTDTAASTQDVEFPLAGLSAALLWIDEQQVRIGSERVASAAPYGLLPAGQEQAELPDIPQDVLDRHQGDPDCEAFNVLANGRDFVSAALDEDHTLYMIPCWSAAYNFGQKAYLKTFDTIETLYFADYSDETGWTGTPYVVNGYYDPEFKEIGSFNKARGVGDCGSSGTWKWNGYAFRMEEFREKACSDEPVDENAEVGDFPVIFTAPPMPEVDND